MTERIHSPRPQKAIVTVSDTDLSDTDRGSGVTALRWRLQGVVSEGACLAVIDVSEGDQISSTLLAALLDTHRVCRRRGGGGGIAPRGRKPGRDLPPPRLD